MPGYCCISPVLPTYGSCTRAIEIPLFSATCISSMVASLERCRFAWMMCNLLLFSPEGDLPCCAWSTLAIRYTRSCYSVPFLTLSTDVAKGIVCNVSVSILYSQTVPASWRSIRKPTRTFLPGMRLSTVAAEMFLCLAHCFCMAIFQAFIALDQWGLVEYRSPL